MTSGRVRRATRAFAAAVTTTVSVVAVAIAGQPAAGARPTEQPPLARESAATTTLSIKVVGNHFVNGAGHRIRLLGVNHTSAEYGCVDGFGYDDGHFTNADAKAIASWGADAVRVPLNEDCWLGINGVNAAVSGPNYITAVANYVSLFRQNGIYVMLEMHWNAPGTNVASTQMPMADADHAIDFWKGVANQFKDDGGVLFDLYNEPHLDNVPSGGFVAGTNSADAWSCWLNGGCTITPQTWEQQTGGYVVAGMQAMLDAVRSTGSKNLVLAGGLNWSNDLSGWAAHAPHDSANNLAASAHVYYKPEYCMGAACYATLQSFLSATQIPIVTGEVGEFDCEHTFLDGFMNWADSSGVSYLAWSWSLEPCGSPGPSYSAGPSLITDWKGTPTAYGQGFKDHLATLKSGSLSQ